MAVINPPPVKVPESLNLDAEAKAFLDELLRTVYQLWYWVAVLGGTVRTYKTITATYTVKPLDDVVDCLSGTFTVTLPPVVGIEGKYYDIKNNGVGVITLEGDGSETIDGQPNQTLGTKDSLQVLANGTEWIIL